VTTVTQEWFKRRSVDNECGIERTDYTYSLPVGQFEDIPLAFHEAIVEYFELQRLMPDEAEQLKKLLQEGRRPDGRFRQKLILAFAEGLLGEDLRTISEDTCLGTFAEVFFKWVRESDLGDRIIYCCPEFATGSSTKQGVYYFEIIGNKD
jgi:hypothetical protein